MEPLFVLILICCTLIGVSLWAIIFKNVYQKNKLKAYSILSIVLSSVSFSLHTYMSGNELFLVIGFALLLIGLITFLISFFKTKPNT